MLISPNGYEFKNKDGIAEKMNDLLSGKTSKTDASSMNQENQEVSPRVVKPKNDLPFKRRTLSIAGHEKRGYLNDKNLDSLQGDSI